MAVYWTDVGLGDFAYVKSDSSIILGNQLQIDIYMQKDLSFEIYYDDFYDEELILSGYGGTTVYWTPPLSLAADHLKTTSFNCNLRIYIYDYTGNVIGTAYQDIRLYFPQDTIGPKISNYELVDGAGHYDVYEKYIQNASIMNLKVTVELHTYGAPLTTAAVAIGDVRYTTTDFTINEKGLYDCNFSFLISESSKTQVAYITITDSRNFSSLTNFSIDVIPYKSPVVTIGSPYRCDADGNAVYNGTYACVVLNASASSLDGLNTLQVCLNWTAASTDETLQSDKYIADSSLIIQEQKIIFYADADENYTVFGQCWDEINNKKSINRYVTKVQPMLDIDRDNNAFGIGTTAKEANTVCFGAKVIFEQGAEFPVTMPNLLDNSNFTNVVDQDIDLDDFVFDRWHGDCAVSITNGVGITIPSDGQIWQYIPTDFTDNRKIFNQDNVFTTAAMDTDGTVYIISGKFADNPSSKVIAMNSDYSVTLHSGSYKWIALYEGEYNIDNLPQYYPKGYAQELAECRRYCQKFRYEECPGFARYRYQYYEFSSGAISDYRFAKVTVNIRAPMRLSKPTIVSLDDKLDCTLVHTNIVHASKSQYGIKSVEISNMYGSTVEFIVTYGTADLEASGTNTSDGGEYYAYMNYFILDATL